MKINMINNKSGQAPTYDYDKTNSILHRFDFKVINQDKSSIGNSIHKLVKNRNRSRMSGQVMLMTVIMLSGAILASTSLAGLLILYQLRQSTDSASSTKAIFAADAGIERALFKEKKGSTDSYPLKQTLSNSTTGNSTQYTVTQDPANPLLIKSIGQSGRTARAFQIDLSPPIIP